MKKQEYYQMKQENVKELARMKKARKLAE